MECQVCLEEFNAAQRRPKRLPCGHTLCLHCLLKMPTKTCPACRKPFSGPATSLPDNYLVLSLIVTLKTERFWCRVCGKAATPECVELKHDLCTLRQLRAEQAAPRLQQLQNAAASARKVVQALQGARDAVEAQLEEWRGRLRQVEEAERELRAAVDEGRDAVQVDGLEQLQDAASLLEARCRLQLQVHKDGAEWKGDLQLAAVDGAVSLFGPLLAHLHQNGRLVKVRQPEATPAARVFQPEECRDVEELSKREEHGKELEEFLVDPCLDEVRKLDRVWCEKWPHWCKVLLQRVAPRLESLWIINDALREHLEVIRDMPALRYLRVHLKTFITDAPDLPLQLEDLTVFNFSEQQLLSVQRMPNLRKLTLIWSPGPLEVSFPPLPPHHRGLQWLCVFLHPASTVLSLAKAHAATLQELRLLCASEGDSVWHFKDLAEGLRQCGLVALRRVVLVRGPAPGFPDRKLPHGQESCKRQKQAVWEKLLAADSGTVRVIKVLCEECDMTPAHPKLGNFTWRDTTVLLHAILRMTALRAAGRVNRRWTKNVSRISVKVSL